jgi:SAM-dependent methyltransferase
MASSELESATAEFPSPPLRMCCRLCGTSGQTEIALSNGEMKLVKCKACGVGFVDPPPDPVFITRHFQDDYITDDFRLEKVYGDLRKAALTGIARQVHRRKREGRILDIGCAGGYFLDRYFRSPNWEKFGVEPSRYALRRARQRGIKTYEGEMLSVELPPRFFDVIIAAGVLPYFCEPRKELRIIRRSLKPDGLLVIELPLGAPQVWRHATKLGRMAGGGSRSIFDSPHVFFYDLDSLRLLLRETGFRLDGFWPSPGNQQAGRFHNILFRCYYEASRLLSWSSGGRTMLGPGLLICANPGV